MALVDLVMPKMGESIMEATVLKWHKRPGDFVKQDEAVLDIATDKVDSEVPATTECVLEEVLFNEKDVVPVGTVIARIRVGVAEGNGVAEPEEPVSAGSEAEPVTRIELQPTKKAVAQEPEVNDAEEVPYLPASHLIKSEGSRFYSPLV